MLAYSTGKLKTARRNVVIGALLGAAAALTPLLFVHDIVLAAICLSLGFFCAELAIGPMWATTYSVEKLDFC